MISHKDDSTDYQLKKVLHEPLAPYIAGVRNNLTHLVQGLVLAAIFYVISIQEQFTPIVICNLIVSFTLVISIWHNSITATQYNVIRLKFLDTFIPVILALFQCLLVLSVNQPTYIFNLILIAIFIILELFYLNEYIKHQNPIAIEAFRNHFKVLGTQFAEDLLSAYNEYPKDVMEKALVFIIILSILTLFNYYFPLNAEIKTIISTILVVIFLMLGNYFDLNYFFNNSEKLKKYGYEW